MKFILKATLFIFTLACVAADFTQFTDVDSFNYFKARGVDTESDMRLYTQTDLDRITNAITIQLKFDHEEYIRGYLPTHHQILSKTTRRIDHVGLELLGPINAYLSILQELAPRLGLKITKSLVFPSTQVVKVLQQEDPNVKGVTIARVYFKQENIEDAQEGCLELFQVALQHGEHPQNIQYTLNRILDPTPKGIIPIDHISIRLDSVKAVEEAHLSILELAETDSTLIPYQTQVSFNPADRSTNTKLISQGRVVELVYYDTI